MVVDDDEGVEVAAEGAEDAEPEAEAEAEEPEEEEKVADTAAKSGPAAAAVKAKGDVVPKESDLPEVEAAEKAEEEEK